MANTCSNYLKVGPTPTAGRPFLERLENGGFGAFVPEPPDAGVEWRLHNWGDKWDIAKDDSDFDRDRAKARFVTAYEPPTEWFRQVAGMFPDLTFELHYAESGNHLWGWMQSNDGIFDIRN
jgi:hypothetical protein